MQSYFHRFSVYVRTGEIDLNKLRWTRIFSKTGEKNLPFLKRNPDTCGEGLNENLLM